jgi:hypothetical protein
MPSNDSDDRAAVCAYVYSDGRTCRMLLASSRSQFCLFHERKLRNLREADYTAAEICEPLSHDFVPATALTQSLTRAFRAVLDSALTDHKSTNSFVLRTYAKINFATLGRPSHRTVSHADLVASLQT